MSFQIILHIENTDPVLGEVEELPNPSTQLIKVDNPTLRDGNELQYLQNEVATVYWPISRINFIEVLPSREEEQIIGFVRE
jgi:hypothetical protein